MKYTVEEFALEIREMYPGDYDDLSDEKLVKLWLRKYPDDIEKIQLKSIRIKEYQKTKIIYRTPVSWIIIIVLPIILFITNPEINAHYKEAKIAIKNSINKNIKNNIEDDTFSALGIILSNSLLDENIDKIIFRKDYFLFSLTILNYDGTDYIIGIGILEKVYISNEVSNQIDNIIKK